MLSGVLNSERAVQVNIAIMRAFVRLRQILATNKELAHKLEQLERKIEKHDTEIQAIFEAIRQLMAPLPEKPKETKAQNRLSSWPVKPHFLGLFWPDSVNIEIERREIN